MEYFVDFIQMLCLIHTYPPSWGLHYTYILPPGVSSASVLEPPLHTDLPFHIWGPLLHTTSLHLGGALLHTEESSISWNGVNFTEPPQSGEMATDLLSIWGGAPLHTHHLST